VAIEPSWPAIRSTLEADIAYRAGRLAAGGPLAAFADLHPEVTWRDGALHVDRTYDFTVELGGRGILLVPVAFAWPELWAMIDPPWQPAIIYAPRGVATLWAPEERPADALADLLGRRRAAVLAGLADAATTQELARRLAASPAGVSEHLSVLRRAGLISGRREGRAVRYARTPAGDALVRSAGS
jgi:DNA-binding transcriptional ArsR family regulator